MDKPNIKKKYNYKNISCALAVALILVLTLSTSCHKSSEKKNQLSEARSNNSISSAENSSSSKKNTKLTGNYKYLAMDNNADLCKGSLAVVNSQYPFKGSPENLDNIYSYLFDTEGTQILYASGSEIHADKDALKNFNQLAVDFYKQSGSASLLISSAYSGNISEKNENQETNSDETEESQSQESQAEQTENNQESSEEENSTGLVFDILTYDQSTGTYPEFTGADQYAWIVQNCYKYGFIQSDPENNQGRFRYVGKVNSQIMKDKNMTLEKYNEFIKDYSFEKPLSYIDENDNSYFLYYVKSEKGESTNVPVAQKEDGSEYKYDISGNNTDGYVVCIYYDYTESENDSSLTDDDNVSEDSSDNDNSDIEYGVSSIDSTDNSEYTE